MAGTISIKCQAGKACVHSTRTAVESIWMKIDSLVKIRYNNVFQLTGKHLVYENGVKSSQK